MPPQVHREELLQQLHRITQEFINQITSELILLNDNPDNLSPTSDPLDPDDDMSSQDSDSIHNQQLSAIAQLKDFIKATIDIEEQILNTRVLNPPVHMPKHLKGNLERLWWYKENREEDFRHFVRVSPATFDRLVEMLEPSPEFHNNSNNPQIEVRIQLAIVLNRLGHYGNAASVIQIADWAGVSEGSVVNCTRRVILSLLNLHDVAFAKPTAEMIRKSKEFAQRVCEAWAEGHMSGDGSNLPVFTKPGHFGESYFDKSSRYSLNLQVSQAIVNTCLY